MKTTILSRLYALVALLVWWCAMVLLGFEPMDLQVRQWPKDN